MATNPQDFRFDYTKYQSTAVSIEALEGVKKVATSPTSNIFDQIAVIVRLIILVAIEWLRSRRMNEEMLIQKQDYEIRRTNQGSSDIGQDDLD